MDESHLKTRRGLGWDMEPYINFIKTLCELNWDTRDLSKLSEDDISTLANVCYVQWADGRRDYVVALSKFIKMHQSHITDDCFLYRNGCDVMPPELKSLRLFVQQVINAIRHLKLESEFVCHSADNNYAIPLKFRKAITTFFKCSNSEDFDKTFRKVNKTLKDRRAEIISILQFNVTIDDDISLQNNDIEIRSSRIVQLRNRKFEFERIEHKIIHQIEDGIQKMPISRRKGLGVISLKPFKAPDFICEYAGDLLSYKEGLARHESYSFNLAIKSYIFDFKFDNVMYSVDATKDDGRLGRLINHSRYNNNTRVKALYIAGRIRLLIFASKDIEIGDEILFDYGDRNPTAIKNHPWLLK